ncbi:MULTISPECIES: efflux RND transporter periplasmic adaptor subunit [Trichocoleus]|uniref:Efflux RND transporter periplasmic adaptor subunit n=1 Tax=Trichocoleus desertorum GB2-A4 TaxID=2933944 RepID=A0ABV0J343_9CYAN|nr:efflux RND transporter periplasmic adaptor subunit [Trichocoleus sp. FACHB-46]MBD1860297.1 efflux RND transporter periplasmic adaptor subunit [Trichocoleus sp. FACHB-46]
MQLPIIGKVEKPTPWILGLIVAGVLGVSGTAFLVNRAAAPREDISELTVPVQAENLRVRITANGTLVPIQSVNLSPKAAGIVKELYVEQGDRVEAGDVVARMDNSTFQAELTQAQANLSQAQANLAKARVGNTTAAIGQVQASVAQAEAQVREAEARLALASDRVRRNESLAAEGAISRDRLDEVISEADRARASVEQTQAGVREARRRLEDLQNGSRPEDIAVAEARVREAEGRVQAVQTQIDDTAVRAPFAGIITQKYATAGAFVTPTTSASTNSSATSTSVVALASGLEVLAEVPEVDINQVSEGQGVEIVADAFPDQVFQGKVRLIAPAAVKEQNVTSFQIRVALVTGKDKLRSGMNVDLTFLGKQLDQALVVPTVAIVTQEGQTGVLVTDAKNQPTFKPVTIGPTIGNQTQVLQGLETGEKVFVELPENKKLEDFTKTKGDQKNN